jgi:hypothetical protein
MNGQNIPRRILCALLGTLLIFLCGSSAWALTQKKAEEKSTVFCPASAEDHVRLSALQDDGFTVSDGRAMKLTGIFLPSQDRTALQARNAMLTVPELGIATGGSKPDRYGRAEVEAFAGDQWIQGQILSDGLALVMLDAASTPCAEELYKAEQAARMAGRGHWGDGTFHVLTPQELEMRAADFAGTFQIIEGTVVSAAVVQSRAYFNFGADRKTDFTVTVAPSDMKAFRKRHGKPEKLAGKRIQVRGWIELYNGPEIVLSRAESLIDLEAPAKADSAKTKKSKRAETGAAKEPRAKKTTKKNGPE